MQLNYIKLKDFLSDNQKEKLLKQAHETTDWIVHKSSKSGRLSPLHFTKIDYTLYGRQALLMMMKPNTTSPFSSQILSSSRIPIILNPRAQSVVEWEYQERLWFAMSN